MGEMIDRAILDEQLRVLAECGVRLSSPELADLLPTSVSLQGDEEYSYLYMLCDLGGFVESDLLEKSVGYISDNIWHFDTECIDGPGAYAAIAERMATLAQGDLPLEKIEDYVDSGEGEAWLSFILGGQLYKCSVQINDDWVDPFVFSRFADLLASRNAGKRFTYIDLGGQDCLIGCATPEQRECLEARTGLRVEWLT